MKAPREASRSQPGHVEYMDLARFVDLGFLQEVNRQFLHPLGLALALDVAGGRTHVWDCRSDPEGIVFDEGLCKQEKADIVQQEYDKHAEKRRALFGGEVIQPISG